MALLDYLKCIADEVQCASYEEVISLHVILRKDGIEEPSQLGFLCQNSGAIAPSVVERVCGESSSLRALFTGAVQTSARQKEGAISLLLLRASSKKGGGSHSSGCDPPLGADGSNLGPPSKSKGVADGFVLGDPLPGWGAHCKSSGPPLCADGPGLGSTRKRKGAPKFAPKCMSIEAKETAAMDRAVAYAGCIFRKFGTDTERYRYAYGPGAPQDAEQLLFLCFRRGARSAAGLRQRVSVASRFLQWANDEQMSVTALTEWGVARWVSLQAQRCKTGAVRAVSALRWVEGAFGILAHSRSSLVIGQLQRGAGDRPQAPPAKARCPDEEQIGHWERMVVEHPSVVVRAYAGIICALTHGMLRWSDVQRSQQLHLTLDAVTGRSVMKNQNFLTPWAAPRRGFLDFDWGGPWLKALKDIGLPGKDFLVYGISRDCLHMQFRIAEYKDCLLFMRTMLVQSPFNLTKEQAATFTVHGFRHVYNTAMRQMNIRTDNIEDAGHWKRGSAMALTYDSAECVLELSTKENVRLAVAAGWRRVDAACLPNPVPGTPAFLGAAPCTPVPAVVTASCPPSPCGWEVRTEAASSSCTAAPTTCTPSSGSTGSASTSWVINMKTQVLHLWRSSTTRTVCRSWKCGTPLQPTSFAHFPNITNLKAKHFDCCMACGITHDDS